MLKILKSLVVIGAVAGLTVGATSAFFSDKETSTGNVFTAGGVDLKVDSQANYNGKPVEGSSWDQRDLTKEKFFNFGDVKPGDWGENTISLHVVDNDAWACLTINNMANNDNSCTEPEKEAENGDCGKDPNAGELAQNLYFTAWAEEDGDNIWQANEPLLFTNRYGPASDVLNGRTYALADSTTVGGPFLKSHTYYIGLQWCAGTMTVDEVGHTISCDGASLGNEVQTDSVSADISFYVEQARNNPNFVCGQRPI